MDEILVQLGFDGPARALDAVARDQLGLPPAITAVRVARAQGALRALIVEIAADGDVRSTLAAVARQLSVRVPHLLWTVMATQTGARSFTVMTWRACAARPQLLALTTQRGAVADSDAETLCALGACAGGQSGDVMRHLRWLDVLGREAITRRFYRSLEQCVNQLAASLGEDVPIHDAREMALLTTSRMLFLSFLETKGWLNADFGFLANGFAECMTRGGGYQRRILEPLFFGTLNTRTSARAARARAFGRVPFLNGGLFARSALERQWRRFNFSDDALGALFGDLLVRYRFTPHEGASDWSEAAIDPEILGKAFESLMSAAERKTGGVFYTPQAFVERLTTLTLTSALACDAVPRDMVTRALEGEALDEASCAIVLGRTSTMRILDPACGSGAFLVHVLERVAMLRVAVGDMRQIAAIRRTVLSECIYGVDVNPMAVWLCELRLWLASVIESDEGDPMRVAPLPNLDRQIRVGDSLAAAPLAQSIAAGSLQSLPRLRQRYTRATGRRKVTLARALDRAERARAIEQLDRSIERICGERREVVLKNRATDLFNARVSPDAKTVEQIAILRRSVRSIRARRTALERGGALPFSYASHFADAADAGGFDMIVGNPPWIRLHNISSSARESYRDAFVTFRRSAWKRGANAAGAGTGFGGQADAAALFVERSCELVKRPGDRAGDRASGGAIGLLLPSKLWRSLAGGGLRGYVGEHMHITALEDLSEAPASFDAAVYPSMLVAVRHAGAVHANADHSVLPGAPIATSMLAAGVQRGPNILHWPMMQRALPLDDSAGSPWMIVPPTVRIAFDAVSAAGTAMAISACGRPWLGVKTGCNAAFVVRRLSEDRDLTRVSSRTIDVETNGEIETACLRRLVRGETLTAWTITPGHERIVWTHDHLATPLDVLPPHTLKWLSRWQRVLERRSDARSSRRWWSLFRLEAADHSGARVVWNDFGRAPRAAILLPGDDTVPLNSCYVARCNTIRDAYALTAILNSPLAAAWLSIIAEPARGGYHRYLGWTMALLPLPREWVRACDILTPIAQRAMTGDIPSMCDLNRAVLAAYRLDHESIAPLMEWVSRA